MNKCGIVGIKKIKAYLLGKEVTISGINGTIKKVITDSGKLSILVAPKDETDGEEFEVEFNNSLITEYLESPYNGIDDLIGDSRILAQTGYISSSGVCVSYYNLKTGKIKDSTLKWLKESIKSNN